MVHTVAFRKSGLYYILRLFNFCTSAWNNEEIFKESWQEKKEIPGCKTNELEILLVCS